MGDESTAVPWSSGIYGEEGWSGLPMNPGY